MPAAIAVLHDVTPAKRVEQNVLRADRLASLGTLAASMAHEIKNALVAVKTFVDLLRQHDPEPDLTEIVGREIRRIDSILSQMLKLAGPAKPSFVPLHAHDVLAHSLRLVQHQIEGKKVHLHRDFRATPDWIQGDEYQLQQAFINFFFNALEAMGPEGQLSVMTDLAVPDVTGTPARKSQSYFRLRIQDTGIGVPPENLDRLFEPFFTTKPNGTGLGLPISRRIIEEHGGTVAVQSELNKGTLLSILLPLHRKAA
jgi:signal transduction histidine kinase